MYGGHVIYIEACTFYFKWPRLTTVSPDWYKKVNKKE